MIIRLQKGISHELISELTALARRAGFMVYQTNANAQTTLAFLGNGDKSLMNTLAEIDGVDEISQIKHPFTLASRQYSNQSTRIDVNGVCIGGDTPIVIAGPCSVESLDQILLAADQVKASGAHMLRGGAFKPRSSPYSFQGLQEEGLKLLAKARHETGLPIVSEVMDPIHLPMVAEYVDVLQIGARNMQNFHLLKELGRVQKPVLLKRGLSATIEEWLMAAEYILSSGNPNVILCERGIRTFETYTRNTLDLNAIPVVKDISHLPVLVDPSHGVGIAKYVPAMSLAGLAAGADGLIIEMHPNPEKAVSDGQQSLTPEQLSALLKKINSDVREKVMA